MTLPAHPIQHWIDALAKGQCSSRALTELALDASTTSDQASATFILVHAEKARATADAADRMRGADVPIAPLAGVPISIKDLFNERAQVTQAVSRVLAGATAADNDFTVVRRLRAAGAVIVGRTNMTEFAYSGLGLNPHYSTPLNPWDRATGRIPGGSSSGAAVLVTDGMAVAAVATDTGGSVRIPAALWEVRTVLLAQGRHRCYSRLPQQRNKSQRISRESCTATSRVFPPLMHRRSLDNSTGLN